MDKNPILNYFTIFSCRYFDSRKNDNKANGEENNTIRYHAHRSNEAPT